MGYMMRQEQAFKRHVEAEGRRRAEAGHDDAAMRRAMYIRQLEDDLDSGAVERYVGRFREQFGDEVAEQLRAEFEEKIAGVRAEGPVGCSCGCTDG